MATSTSTSSSSCPSWARSRPPSKAPCNDILNAFIRSGDLGGFVSRFVARHTDNIGPEIDCTGGGVTFQNGNVTVNADFVAHNSCSGLDVNFSIQASGPPIISNGYMSIGAQYLDVSVDGWDEFLCYLITSLTPLGWILLSVVLIALSGGHDAPVKSVNVSLAVTPLPDSETDWSIVMKQATATGGTLTLDGGDVLFIINTATSGGTPALNNVGGIVTTSRSQTDNYTGKLISSVTTHSYVLEGEPDFGVTVTDASGMVRATRRLVARNAIGNRVGSKDSPVIVEVPRVIVINPGIAG
jgi:hypothetical protein